MLAADDLRPPGRSDLGGWSEIGQLDRLRHSLGMRLTRQINAEIETITEHVVALLEAGWSRVRVVTDHGWQLLPGGLPKVELPHHLAATRWARCAVVKGASPATEMPDLRLALECRTSGLHHRSAFAQVLAGAGCPPRSQSPQECIVPDLTDEAPGTSGVRAKIGAISWGLRCRVAGEGATRRLR